MSHHWTIMEGDVRDRLKDLAPASVQCIVTSPPYWGLRDYGEPGQLGLEATPDEYVANLVQVFRELRRVLRDDGTAWLNLGDSYSRAPEKGGSGPGKNADYSDSYGLAQSAKAGSSDGAVGRADRPGSRSAPPGLKPKDLCMIPARVAIALQADGWWLRSDVIWNKPNPMPESVTDRPTRAHEFIFILSKSPQYFYDADAIREEATGTGGGAFGKVSRPDEAAEAGAQARRYDRPDYRLTGRNARTVWTFPVQPYPGAHFATFPEALPERCIQAGTSEHGCCATCGMPCERVVERKPSTQGRDNWAGSACRINDTSRPGGFYDAEATTVGWRVQCGCVDEPDDTPLAPCVVLDPFSGSGTTGVVACKLGREYIGIELNPEYAQLSRNRIGKALSPSTHVDETTPVDAPLFNPDQEQQDGKDT